MFRQSPAPIIRSTQTVVTTTGTSHEFEDKIRIKKTPWPSSYLAWLWPNLAMSKFCSAYRVRLTSINIYQNRH